MRRKTQRCPLYVQHVVQHVTVNPNSAFIISRRLTLCNSPNRYNVIK